MATLHGVAADEAQLRHTHGHRPFDVQTILLAAKSLGLTAKAASSSSPGSNPPRRWQPTSPPRRRRMHAC